MSILFNSAKTGGTGNQVTQIIQVGAGSQQQELKLSLGFIKLDAGHDHGLLRLLKWNGRVSPLLGRDAVLAQLRAWLADPQGDPVQIVSGPGGVGKTRLAAEFAQELRDPAPSAARSRWNFFRPKTPQPARWKAGFVALDDLGESLTLHGDEAALCILDYPEERTASLRRWIDALAAMPGGQRKLRVLFVTRDTYSVSKIFLACNQQHLLPSKVINLATIATEDGCQVLNATLTRLAELGYPAKEIEQTDFTAWRNLSPMHEFPLFVVALAIHLAGNSDTPASLQLTGTHLLDALCEREEARLNNIAKNCGTTMLDTVADVLAWATLLDKLDPVERTALCDVLLPGQGSAVHQALQASGAISKEVPVLAHLEPDLRAAWWLHRWKQRLDALGTWDAHTRALAGQMAQREPGAWSACVPHWNRLSNDLASRLGQTSNAIDAWAAQHITTTWRPHAVAVRKVFERQTSWHGLQNAAIAASQVETFVATEEDNEASALEECANRLNNHAVYLADAGERDPALAAVREAVKIRRRLAQSNPIAFEPVLAMSLNNLAKFLSTAGEHNTALATAHEAVEIHRRLAQTHPAMFEPDLATSLNNLANRLSAVGERDAALATAREVVEIRRRLVQTNPTVFEPDLATSLNSLANRLSDTGERNAALATAREAVEIVRRLAQTNPAAFGPNLAMSLNNLASYFSDIGERNAALATAQEAVEIYSRLAQTHPDTFEPDLAMSLNNLASCFSDTGERNAALATAREAMEIYRRLAQMNPAAFEPVLATSLNNLANRLSDAGEYEAALATAREAVDIVRRLAQTHPAAFEPDLARSLSNLANRLSVAGEYEAALVTAREAVEIYRRLAQTHPAAFEPDLARSLAVLARACLLGDDRVAARDAANESLALIEPWAQQIPAAYTRLRDVIRGVLGEIDGAAG